MCQHCLSFWFEIIFWTSISTPSLILRMFTSFIRASTMLTTINTILRLANIQWILIKIFTPMQPYGTFHFHYLNMQPLRINKLIECEGPHKLTHCKKSHCCHSFSCIVMCANQCISCLLHEKSFFNFGILPFLSFYNAKKPIWCLDCWLCIESICS